MADDANAVYDYWSSDPSWEKYNASVPAAFTLADAEGFVATMRRRERSSAPNWAIVYADTVIGVVSLVFEQDNRIAVVGYGVHGDLRGRGFSTEATAAVIDQAFMHSPDLFRVRAHANAENIASHRVLKKLGFAHEGTLRNNQFVKGGFVDEVIYGLLRDEWVHNGR